MTEKEKKNYQHQSSVRGQRYSSKMGESQNFFNLETCTNTEKKIINCQLHPVLPLCRVVTCDLIGLEVESPPQARFVRFIG